MRSSFCGPRQQRTAVWWRWLCGGFQRTVPPSQHPFKYRLVFVRNGKRIVGYDNERGKGDHKHLHGQELLYAFADIDTLISDFLADVEANP